jgi:ribA/ribD-fused uncharacterized protein
MIINNVIVSFDGEESWLSNFYDSPIEYRGRTYLSVEHAYHSEKSSDESWKQICSDWSNNAGKIKRLSRDIVIVSDWDSIKKDVMWSLLNSKYNLDIFKDRLLNTNDMIIREGNRWGDFFWGTSLDGTKGNNELGKMIMKIRTNLKSIPLF